MAKNGSTHFLQLPTNQLAIKETIHHIGIISGFGSQYAKNNKIGTINY